MRAWGIWSLGLILCAGSLWARQEPSQRPVFRAGTDVVTIDVSVRRRNGPVTGLTARDFELLDNGVPQAIELQTIDAMPVDVTAVFGRYYVTFESQLSSDLSKAADWLRPIDRLRVIAFATDVREVVPMDAPRSSLREGVTRAKQWLAGPDQSNLDSRHDPTLRGGSLIDALILALARPAELGRRHLVVAFCNPLDKGSVVADGNLLRAVAARTDALLHIAHAEGPSGATLAPSEPIRTPLGGPSVLAMQYLRLALTGAAEATGGAIHSDRQGVGLKSILADFRRSYLLRYTLTGVAPGGWHTVTVKTPAFPNYEVRARQGYMGR